MCKLPGLLAPQAQVIACLNSPDLCFDFLRDLFNGVGGFVERKVIEPPESFPENDANRGLKTLLFEKNTEYQDWY